MTTADDTPGCLARRAAARVGDAVALRGEEHAVTYRQLEQATGRAAARLSAEGLAAGEPVAVCMRDRPLSAVYLFALLRMGCTFVPLGPRLPRAELAARARRAGCRFWIADPDRAVPASAARCAPLDTDLDPCVDRVQREAWDPGDRLRGRPAATLIFTSGSSGPARAVSHGLEAHVASARGAAQNVPLRPGHVWAVSLSLSHIGGLAILFRTLLAGATARFVATADLGALVAAGGATHVSLVYTQLKRLLAAGLAPGSLEAVLVGGSAVEHDVIEEAYGSGWPVLTTYGSTEMASQITTSRPGAPREELRTSGRLLAGRELRIVDGEIQVRGAVRFDRYVTEDGSLRPFDAEGWFATGDLGELRSDGCLVVTGRRDAMFVTGGENVQPERVEAAVRDAGLATECVVVSIPDAEYGHRPVAFVRPHPTTADELERWRKRLLDAMPSYAIPRTFLALPSHIDTAVSKVDRKALQQLAIQRSGP